MKENILLKQVMFVQSMTTTGGPSTKWAFLWFWPHNTRRPSTPQQYQATPSLIFFFRLTARLNYAQAGRNKKRGKLTKLLIIWVNTNWGLDNVILKGRKCNKIIDLHNSHNNIRCWKDNNRAFTKSMCGILFMSECTSWWPLAQVVIILLHLEHFDCIRPHEDVCLVPSLDTCLYVEFG